MLGGLSGLDEPLMERRSTHGTFEEVRSSNVFRSSSPSTGFSTTSRTGVERLHALSPLLRLLGAVLLSPFVGLIFVAAATYERYRPTYLSNPNDWMVLLGVGLAFQVGSIVPLAYVCAPINYDITMHKDLSGDFYGAIITYVLAGLYLMSVVVIFVELQAKIDRSGKVVRPVESGASNRIVVARLVDKLRAELILGTTLPSQHVMWIATLLSITELIVIRACRFSTFHCTSTLIFFDPAFAHIPQFWFTSAYYFLIYWTTNTISLYAVLLQYQQLRVTEAFTCVGGTSGSTASPVAATISDLASESNATVWVQVWQQLVLDVKRRPVTRALIIPSVLMLIVLSLTGIAYVVSINLIRFDTAAQFTAGSVQFSTYAVIVLAALIAITVRMSNVVETQTKRIAAVQNDVQRRIDDEKGTLSALELQVLTSKVRVLQALDVYLRHADSRPKLVGMSLESMRWTGIILGLVSLNAFFFGLYISRCR